ncbi:DMT family transporter [Celeribacter sp.]|uniref:DMT family transporter n=1 Tax=Celeribacter sp. TaxID=1890673 RepID=UPI003A8CD883
MIWFSRLSDTARGILFMVVSVTAFSFMDAMAKLLGQRVDISQILLARYGGQIVVLMIVFGPRMTRLLRTDYPRLQLLRAAFQLMAAGSFFYALKFIGLAEATAVADVAPVLITLGAALILGEKVGPRRAFGIAAALVGALIIIRPGSGVFSPAALLPLIAACALAGYAIITRFIGNSEPPQTGLLYSGLFGTAVMLLVAPFRWVPLDAVSVALMVAVAVIGSLGQFMMIRAYSSAEASVVAPFSYAGLLTATFWGVVIFDAFPDLWTVVGGLVVVSAGLYVWHRETRRGAPSPLAQSGSQATPIDKDQTGTR